jgi:hypothetical protein
LNDAYYGSLLALTFTPNLNDSITLRLLPPTADSILPFNGITIAGLEHRLKLDAVRSREMWEAMSLFGRSPEELLVR